MAEPTVLRPDAQGRPTPTLADIVGRLRLLADDLERGDYSVDDDGDPVMPRTMLLVTYCDNGEIRVHAFGEACTMKVQVVGILALAQRVFSNAEGDISRGDAIVGDRAPVVPIK